MEDLKESLGSLEPVGILIVVAVIVTAILLLRYLRNRIKKNQEKESEKLRKKFFGDKS